MYRLNRFVPVALILLACLAACVTPRYLHDSVVAGRADALQPVMTLDGNASPTRGNAIIERVSGDAVSDRRSAVEEQQLLKLTDAVRRSLSSPLVAGNRVTALVDGPATFKAIDAAVLGAQRNVHVETYIFADDELGRKFAQLLIQKRKQGVEVRVIYDAIGSITTSKHFFDDLHDAGVQVEQFRPLNPAHTLLWKFNNRDHRKLVIVDGRIAFTGGLNITSAYSSGSSSKPGPQLGLTNGWRDTDVQIVGPAVAQFQTLFFNTWRKLIGKKDDPEFSTHSQKYYPPPVAAGDSLVSVVGSQGGAQKREHIYRTYLAAIDNAANRIWITQAYFMPPTELRDALLAAVKRGVDVRIVVPGFTDSKIVLYAERHEYQRLLNGGVHIVEEEDALLHAKTAVIDEALTIIGSANLDYRSFLHNNEVTAVIVDRTTNDRMAALYRSDTSRSKQLSAAQWNKRGTGERVRESLSSLIKYWL